MRYLKITAFQAPEGGQDKKRYKYLGNPRGWSSMLSLSIYCLLRRACYEERLRSISLSLLSVRCYKAKEEGVHTFPSFLLLALSTARGASPGSRDFSDSQSIHGSIDGYHIPGTLFLFFFYLTLAKRLFRHCMRNPPFPDWLEFGWEIREKKSESERPERQRERDTPRKRALER